MPPAQDSPATAADGMLRSARTEPRGCTAAEARQVFEDDHVHALLVVDGGRLLAVVQRSDLVGASPGRPAASFGRLEGRVVDPDAELEPLRRRMVACGTRRLAVVDDDRLLGLLCLKSSGEGFCTDDGVAARAAERAGDSLGSTASTTTR